MICSGTLFQVLEPLYLYLILTATAFGGTKSSLSQDLRLNRYFFTPEYNPCLTLYVSSTKFLKFRESINTKEEVCISTGFYIKGPSSPISIRIHNRGKKVQQGKITGKEGLQNHFIRENKSNLNVQAEAYKLKLFN